MDKITHIILISTASIVDNNIRKFCEEIKGKEIRVFDPMANGTFVHAHILNLYPTLKYDDVQVFGVEDFVIFNNNDDYNPDDWFMSYVYSIVV